eukprot:TRINITY_DN86258_c0_g1_i1.p1 TRINITY_DN86258_c0_g1~~TRINITY_DN86258_c0_g1_i1.p1  ORF type:complete len:111 (+),score=2.19 TRINITY_DN86258_c0_g1_i1:41-334(+)
MLKPTQDAASLDNSNRESPRGALSAASACEYTPASSVVGQPCSSGSQARSLSQRSLHSSETKAVSVFRSAETQACVVLPSTSDLQELPHKAKTLVQF